MIRYLTTEQIIDMNRRLLKATGGLIFAVRDGDRIEHIAPVRDRDRIEYVTAIVQDDDKFPTLWDKAALYLHRLARSQAFADGNKRTALEAADVFLGLNGYDFRSPSAGWTVRYMLAVAQNRKSQEQVRNWLRRRSIPRQIR